MDYNKLMQNKEKVVFGLTNDIEELFKTNKVDYIKGWAKFESPTDINIDLNSGGKS